MCFLRVKFRGIFLIFEVFVIVRCEADCIFSDLALMYLFFDELIDVCFGDFSYRLSIFFFIGLSSCFFDGCKFYNKEASLFYGDDEGVYIDVGFFR
jgi:hypothetical protein